MNGRKLKIAVACMAVMCALGLGAQPASAHNANVNSYLSCGATRQSEEETLTDSHPATMGANASYGWLRSVCSSVVEDLVCFWVAESRTNGTNFVYSGPNCAVAH